MVYPVRKGPGGNTVYDLDQNTNMPGEWNQENKGASSVVPKDSEAHWQDVSQEKPSLMEFVQLLWNCIFYFFFFP